MRTRKIRYFFRGPMNLPPHCYFVYTGNRGEWRLESQEGRFMGIYSRSQFKALYYSMRRLKGVEFLRVAPRKGEAR